MESREIKNLKLLYLEDDKRVRDSLLLTLNELFQKVIVCENATEAFKFYQEQNPDMLLVDIQMSEGIDGIEFIKKIRISDTETPIIIASAHGTAEYLLRAIPLNLIAFLVKPFDLESLLGAFYTALQQSTKQHKAATVVYFPNGSYFDPIKQCVWDRDSKRVELQFRELLLLELFVKNRSRFLSYAEIFQEIWNSEEVSDITLRTLITKLRAKIGRESIITLAGYGYRLETISH